MNPLVPLPASSMRADERRHAYFPRPSPRRLTGKCQTAAQLLPQSLTLFLEHYKRESPCLRHG
ncbi:hypothetical protein K523DRAFT_59115 [Schizophyllum commune Tattone D]|nr:hypothetical protein K523DRAFT_59115 [Schizophyllum commune Tattone D]